MEPKGCQKCLQIVGRIRRFGRGAFLAFCARSGPTTSAASRRVELARPEATAPSVACGSQSTEGSFGRIA